MGILFRGRIRDIFGSVMLTRTPLQNAACILLPISKCFQMCSKISNITDSNKHLFISVSTIQQL